MAKYKFYGLNQDGDVKLAATESHPKLDASQEDLGSALSGVTSMYDMDPIRIDLSTDTTIYTAS